jgi:uncharacterized protein YggE
MNLKKLATAMLVVVIPLASNAQACESEKRGKATKAAYAGDGVTQFTDTGKLKFGVVYSAHAVDTTDRQNCRWSIKTINSDGESKVIKSGDYLHAKIKVEKPSRVKVYLKSSECGDWKPK